MGFADDPDVDDYYTRARSFPITYSPDDDPEVVKEMCIAAAELKKGGMIARMRLQRTRRIPVMTRQPVTRGKVVQRKNGQMKMRMWAS
jgi:hypothetical protein